MDKPALVTFLKGTELYSNATYKEAIDTADAKYNGVAKVKGAKVKAAPSLEAIKARAQETVAE